MNPYDSEEDENENEASDRYPIKDVIKGKAKRNPNTNPNQINDRHPKDYKILVSRCI